MHAVHPLRRSRDYFERAKTVIPRGVTSGARADVRPVPVAFDRAEGARLWDIDGNEYLDLVCGFGPVLFGHSPEFLSTALMHRISRGVQFGGANAEELELAERIVRSVPCAEIVSLCNSGTEAIQSLLRIARAKTNRHRILAFEGHYHGWIAPLSPPQDPGASPVANVDATRIPWNSVEALEAYMAEHGDETAAVIMEPVPCNKGIFLPEPGYLERVRELCDRYGSLLVFDEVISGFRLGLGGAQALLGVRPDLVALAKAVAGGYPLAVIAGTATAMEPALVGPFRLMGTYNGNGIGLAAANAVLEQLEAGASKIYERLEHLGKLLQQELEAAARATDAPLTLNRVGSVLQLYWGLPEAPLDLEASLPSDEARISLLAEVLLHHGVYLLPRGLAFVSLAHEESDIRMIGRAFRLALAQVVADLEGKDNA